ncbi:MAG: hypothetical protein KDA87_16280 [Planctomycetales bacterium]|nr:hypothetical protein [Planctomycetales bacterium]
MLRKLSIGFLTFVSLFLCGIGSSYLLTAQPDLPDAQKPFAGWTKPPAALFITGNQHGYIEPCGCTGLVNQKGGLMRRHTLLNAFLAKNWNIAPVDAGNQVRRIGKQAEAKFQSTAGAFRAMGYRGVGFGLDDLKLSSGEITAALVDSLDGDGKSDLFVCANVDVLGFVPKQRILELGGKKIGLTAILGSEDVKHLNNPDYETSSPSDALSAVIPQLVAAKCDYIVLLAHTSPEESEALAKQFDAIDFVICAGGHSEPLYKPEDVEGAHAKLIRTGKKGMYVGVLGFFDDPQTPVRYQRLALDSKFQDSPDMVQMMQEYQDKLKTQGLAGLGLTPVRHSRGEGYEFVGSETCGDCHTSAYEKWKNTPHSHATESIVHPPERTQIARHFDPECISCHVTGWNPQAYFPYASGYVDLDQSKHLHGNGCENCHGPGSMHVKAELGEIDVTQEKQRALQLEMRLPLDRAHDVCLECHDLDNSVEFHEDGAFERYWKEIEHKGLD